MKTTDNVSPELRKIEKEIDNHYKFNPLLKLPFATAAWSFLAFAELKILMDQFSQPTSQEQETMGNNFVNELKQPMSWLLSACKPGGKIPFIYDHKVFQASRALFRLSKKYQWFEAAYTFASHGWVELELQGSTIQPAKEFFKGIEYEAYDRLIRAHQSDEALSLVDFSNFPTNAIGHSVKIKADRFTYKLNPRIVSDTIKFMRPAFDIMFSLPIGWQFSRYSLGDFQSVFKPISAIAYIHAMVRREVMTLESEYNNMGYADSVYVPTCGELLKRVVRYSGVSDTKVRSIFDDLTYGNRGIKHLDPALQPLIKLDSQHYAIMPHLWLLLNPERNLTVLFNRIPSERKIYAKLVDEKEGLMKQRFTDDLSDKGFRFVDGNVPNLTDVDLAIIRDSEKTCLLLELKWFIGPAEFREVIEKSEEIKKGISQVFKLKEAFDGNHKLLLEKLDIDSSYRLEGIVVSQNWIGEANVQSPEVPVIRADHLIAKLKATESLRATIEWLMARKYLPKEGKDFEVHGITSTIGKWSVKWSTTRPLIKDAFFPL